MTSHVPGIIKEEVDKAFEEDGLSSRSYLSLFPRIAKRLQPMFPNKKENILEAMMVGISFLAHMDSRYEETDKEDELYIQKRKDSL